MKRKCVCMILAFLFISLTACSDNTVSQEEYLEIVQENNILQNIIDKMLLKGSDEPSIEEENKRAYQLGWAYWFGAYGYYKNHTAGARYLDLYAQGRNYYSYFENTREAFYAGYRDGYYHVNHSEQRGNSCFIEEGYLAYYPEETWSFYYTGMTEEQWEFFRTELNSLGN